MHDIRLIQLARMLGLDPGAALDDASAASLVRERATALADAIFHEAADSDDVVSAETALDYLEGRLIFFGDLVPAETAAAIRRAFRERLRAWE